MAHFSRRQFLAKSSIAAAGAAAIVGAPQLSAAAPAGSKPDAAPSLASAPAKEPVVAYVREGSRDEVRIMVGSRQIVHKDPALVRRLLAAAR